MVGRKDIGPVGFAKPNMRPMEKRMAPLIRAAESFVIKSDADMEAAADLRRRFKNLISDVKDDFDGSEEKPGITKLTDRAHKESCSLRDSLLEPLKRGWRIIGDKMADRRLQQENAKREADEKTRREAEKKEEAKRKAEMKKMEARKPVEPGIPYNIKPKGDPMGQALTAPPVAPMMAEPGTPDGVSFAKRTKWVVIDPKAVRRELCSPDPEKIDEIVRRYGMATKEPGIKVYQDKETRTKEINKI